MQTQISLMRQIRYNRLYHWGAIVHNTTKHKLWANEYADFGLLLPVAQNKPQAKSIFFGRKTNWLYKKIQNILRTLINGFQLFQYLWPFIVKNIRKLPPI